MSLLLTRHVDQYRIDVPALGSGRLRPQRFGTARGEPLADQFPQQTITLADQHAPHGWRPA